MVRYSEQPTRVEVPRIPGKRNAVLFKHEDAPGNVRILATGHLGEVPAEWEGEDLNSFHTTVLEVHNLTFALEGDGRDYVMSCYDRDKSTKTILMGGEARGDDKELDHQLVEMSLKHLMDTEKLPAKSFTKVISFKQEKEEEVEEEKKTKSCAII